MNDQEHSIDDIQMAMNNLFSKYGMSDGEWPYATETQNIFSRYLQIKGYEIEQIGTVHNRRVTSIKVNDSWYLTETLALVMTEDDENWRLTIADEPDSLNPKEPEESIPVPDDLKDAIIAFVPTANTLCYLTPGNDEYKKLRGM